MSWTRFASSSPRSKLPSVAAEQGPVRSAARVALALLAAAAVAAVALDAAGPVRGAVVFLAAVLVPGGALALALGVDDVVAGLGLTIALSLVVETAGSLVMVWTGWFEPDALGAACVVAGLAVLAVDARRTIARAPA